MGKRDLLFAALIVGGMVALASTLAPFRVRPSNQARRPATAPPEIVAQLDQTLRDRWVEQDLKPAPKAPDLVRMRRVSLALTGTIPSLEEIRRFESRPPETRLASWLDELLLDRRSSDYLAERLARAFVGTEGGPFLVYRRRKLVTWLSDELLKNRPYDRIVRDLIAGQGIWTDHPSTNFISVTFDPDKKGYDPERLAARVARAFLGVRIDCAQCHDHPFQPWKRADFRGLAAYFGQVEHSLTGISDGKGEFLVDEKKDGKPIAVEPRLPFQTELDPRVGTRRERLARWVTDPQNANFSKATVNRAWAIVFGRALVEPIDDIAISGEPPAILKLLADDFSAHGFDFRKLIRSIAMSEAFAIDSAVEDEDDSATSSIAEAAWAVFPITRLRPEQVAGGLIQASSTETIDSGSNILQRLGAFNGINDFVTRHGDPGEDEFNLEGSSTIPQRLLMMNGDLLQDHIREVLGNASARIASLAPNDRKAVEAAYLAVLTRRPTTGESAHFEARLAGTKGKDRQQRLTDLIWVLLNTTEFSWNH